MASTWGHQLSPLGTANLAVAWILWGNLWRPAGRGLKNRVHGVITILCLFTATLERYHRILRLLGQLRDQGKLIVFVEHDISAVRRIADRVIDMDGGRIIADGAPQDVLGRPETLEAYLG